MKTVTVAEIPAIVRHTLDVHRRTDGPDALNADATCSCGWWSTGRRWVDHLIEQLERQGVRTGR